MSDILGQFSANCQGAGIVLFPFKFCSSVFLDIFMQINEEIDKVGGKELWTVSELVSLLCLFAGPVESGSVEGLLVCVCACVCVCVGGGCW